MKNQTRTQDSKNQPNNYFILSTCRTLFDRLSHAMPRHSGNTQLGSFAIMDEEDGIATKPKVSFLPYFGIIIFIVEIIIIVLASIRLQSEHGWPSNPQGEKNRRYVRFHVCKFHLLYLDAFNFQRINIFALMLAILRAVLMWPLSYLGVDSRRFWLAVFVQVVMLGLITALAISLASTCVACCIRYIDR
jgi:hypothetical protein